MSKFRNVATGVEVSVADEKDYRFTDGWVSASAPTKPESVESSISEKRGQGRPKKNN